MQLSIAKLQELLPGATLDRRGKYMRANCPACGEPTFTISTSPGHPCGCNRKKHCGYVSNVFGLAKKLGKLSLINIEGEVGKTEKLEALITNTDKELDLTLPVIKMPLGWQRTTDDDYLSSRGFKEYDLFKVGRTPIDPRLKNKYIITAVEQGGEIKGYIARHIWPKKQIEAENIKRKAQGIPEIQRYLNSDNDFSKMLFGLDFIVPGETKTVILVEGKFDVWNVSRLMKLYGQNKVKCVGTFKCHISPEQIAILLIAGIENIVMFYDNDVIREIKKVAGELQLYFNVLVAFNEWTDADAGDIDEATLSKVYSNLKTVSGFSSGKIPNKIN